MKTKVKHLGKRLFITGIPTAGKSYLADKLAKYANGIHVQVDHIRKNVKNHPEYSKWVNFYYNQDKGTYYRNTNYDEQWKNFVLQSEGIWPEVLARMNEYKDEVKPVIFEGVNILPHLASKDLDFPGIVIAGESLERTIQRNTEETRWGDTEIEIQSEAFFFGERPHFIEEGKKYGYEVFTTNDEAFDKALKKLGK